MDDAGRRVVVSLETLKDWLKRLDPYWYSSDGEGEEYNNDGVIEVCKQIDLILNTVQGS
jgi:hypothetical protein